MSSRIREIQPEIDEYQVVRKDSGICVLKNGQEIAKLLRYEEDSWGIKELIEAITGLEVAHIDEVTY